MAKKQVTSCGCFVFRNVNDRLEVLLVKPFHNRDAWGVPKGHQDEGETFLQTAFREVQEETGLNVSILPDEALPLCHTKNHDENKTVRIWLAVVTEPTQALAGDGENADMRWFSLDELPHLHKYQSDMIAAGVQRVKELAESLPSL